VGNTVVVGSCNGLIHGVDKTTGAARWKYDARPDGGRPEFHGAPLVVGDLVVLASDDRRPDGVGHAYAVEASTGAIRWKTRIGRGSMADVVRLGALLYTVTLDNEVVALDLVSGRQAWSFRGSPPLDPGFLNVFATPALDSDRVYFGGADGVLYALTAGAGAVVWKTDVGSRIVTPVVLIADALYFGTRDGRLLRAERSQGKLIGEMALGRMPFGPPTAVGESVLVYSAEGEALVLDAFDLSLTAARWSRRASRGWSSSRPYVWQGLVLAGGEAGELTAKATEDGAVVWSRRVDGVVEALFDGDCRSLTVEGVLFVSRRGRH
jgi:outer membrane protein assembly factor BamB